MNDFFATIRRDFDDAARQRAEIHDMMRAMYARFAKEHGLERFMPPPFSMLKYQKEIDRLERAYNKHFNTLWNMVSKAKFALMKRFFETIASRVKHVYDIANRDVESWLQGGDVAARNAGPRAPPAAAAAPREHQAHPPRERRARGAHRRARAAGRGARRAGARADARGRRRSTRSSQQPDALPLAANAA